MIRDTWRAALVVVTAALLREIVLLPRPAATTEPVNQQATGQWPPQYGASAGWHQQWPASQAAVSWQAAPQPVPPGPIRKVARATVDLAESVLEAVR